MHEGSDRRARRRRPAGDHLHGRRRGRRQQDVRRQDRRLARHHRQVLGRSSHPRPEVAVYGDASRAASRRVDSRSLYGRLRGSLRCRSLAGQTPEGRRRTSMPAPSRSRSSRPTRTSLGIEKFELLIDWGWFYFITKPLYLPDRLALRHSRQLRSRHPRRDRARQGGVLPARQQELREHGEDEEAAAADGGSCASATRTTRPSSSRS